MAVLDATELRMVAVLAGSNIVLNRGLRRGAELPGGLAAAGLMVLMALQSGAEKKDLGFAPDALPAGVRLGIRIGAPIGTALALGAFSKRLGRFYQEERMASSGLIEGIYEFGLRIPIATAAAEEIMFRGSLEAVLQRKRSPGQAAVLASVLFGTWHILPTLHRVAPSDERQRGARGNGPGVVASVAATFLAGLGFSLLRRQTGSIITPIIVHASLNSGGYVGSWLRSRARGPGNQRDS